MKYGSFTRSHQRECNVLVMGLYSGRQHGTMYSSYVPYTDTLTALRSRHCKPPDCDVTIVLHDLNPKDDICLQANLFLSFSCVEMIHAMSTLYDDIILVI